MVAKCNKCGHFTPYLFDEITDEKSNLIQLDLFGAGEPIIIGVIHCNNCGAKIAVKSRSDTIKDLNTRRNEYL